MTIDDSHRQEGDRLFHNAEMGPSESGQNQSQLNILTASPGEHIIHANKYADGVHNRKIPKHLSILNTTKHPMQVSTLAHSRGYGQNHRVQRGPHGNVPDISDAAQQGRRHPDAGRHEWQTAHGFPRKRRRWVHQDHCGRYFWLPEAHVGAVLWQSENQQTAGHIADSIERVRNADSDCEELSDMECVKRCFEWEERNGGHDRYCSEILSYF